jgi:hypothetical protein
MSLQARLIKYLAKYPNQKFSKGALCDLARNSDLKATGEHTGRRLRYLESCYEVEGTSKDIPETQKARQLLKGAIVKVEHRERNHDWYWLEPKGYTPTVAEQIARSLQWFAELPDKPISQAQ